jgi:hypothetical protein
VWACDAEKRDGSGNSKLIPPAARRKGFRAKLQSVNDVQAQLARLYREARSGSIRVEDASRLANILAILGRMIGDSDLEARIAALETGGSAK